MWVVNTVNNTNFFGEKTNISVSDSVSSDESINITGYIITSVIIGSIFLIIIVISTILNARKTNKLCWVSKKLSKFLIINYFFAFIIVNLNYNSYKTFLCRSQMLMLGSPRIR